MPSRRSRSGRKASSERSKAGLPVAVVGPGEQVGADRVDVVVLVREVGLQRLRRTRRRRHQLAQARLVVLGGVDRAVGRLGQAQLLDGVLAGGPTPGRRWRATRAGSAAAAKAGCAAQ